MHFRWLRAISEYRENPNGIEFASMNVFCKFMYLLGISSFVGEVHPFYFISSFGIKIYSIEIPIFSFQWC